MRHWALTLALALFATALLPGQASAHIAQGFTGTVNKPSISVDTRTCIARRVHYSFRTTVNNERQKGHKIIVWDHADLKVGGTLYSVKASKSWWSPRKSTTVRIITGSRCLPSGPITVRSWEILYLRVLS